VKSGKGRRESGIDSEGKRKLGEGSFCGRREKKLMKKRKKVGKRRKRDRASNRRKNHEPTGFKSEGDRRKGGEVGVYQGTEGGKTMNGNKLAELATG